MSEQQPAKRYWQSLVRSHRWGRAVEFQALPRPARRLTGREEIKQACAREKDQRRSVHGGAFSHVSTPALNRRSPRQKRSLLRALRRVENQSGRVRPNSLLFPVKSRRHCNDLLPTEYGCAVSFVNRIGITSASEQVVRFLDGSRNTFHNPSHRFALTA